MLRLSGRQGLCSSRKSKLKKEKNEKKCGGGVVSFDSFFVVRRQGLCLSFWAFCVGEVAPTRIRGFFFFCVCVSP